MTRTDLAPSAAIDDLGSYAAAYHRTRALTETICETLAAEDQVVQTMPNVSPTKWHLAHTTWFFETFVLKPIDPTWQSPDPQFHFLFNSYYETLGTAFPRPERGHITRPTVAEVLAYRAKVDEHLTELLTGDVAADRFTSLRDVLMLGLNHEQQHQELIVTDIKHVLSRNPIYPALRPRADDPPARGVPDLEWLAFDEGVREIGTDGPAFHFDNEGPRHKVYQNAFALGSRLVTNGEFMAFIDDGGYRRHDLWLSLGWTAVNEHGWEYPLYWWRSNDSWMHYTLAGARPVNPDEPVIHVSHYEADAYARWAAARLPTEAEWEVASNSPGGVEGPFLDALRFHPQALPADAASGRLHQMYGDAWQWTQSAHSPYPAYRPPAGALGEYNGKFMSNQMVLRGASCATPANHIRRTYRNFFPPDTRWQFKGIRLDGWVGAS